MPIDSTYEATRVRQLASALAGLPEHMSQLDWPRERIKEAQTARLRSLLATAQERSAWHRERLHGVDAAQFSAGDLSSLPVMTKQDLMSNWDAIVTDPRARLADAEQHLAALTHDAYFLETYHVVASGGSSGHRGVFVWDWDGWSTCYLGFIRWLLRAATRMGAANSAPVLAMVAAEHPSHMTRAAAQTFANPAMPLHRFPVTMALRDIVSGLNEAQPTVLSGYPSMLCELARAARAGDLRIAPRAVVSTSEPLLPEMRQTLQDTWGAPVMNWWGTSEAGATAASCGFGEGMHLSEDQHIIEPVDDAYARVAPGRRSTRVLLTNLINPLMPLIRYEITDEVTVLADPCPCGCVFARVDDIQGRAEDCFSYASGVVIHPHVLRSRIGRDPAIIDYQVRQTDMGVDVDVRCTAPIDLCALERALANDLQAAGLAAADVNVRHVPDIPRTAAGKLARFVPQRGSG